MFREMRRKKQALSAEETAAIMQRGSSGVLALHGDEGYPYALPISYVFDGESIFFHCAKSGHKLDAVRRDERASFCVIDSDDIVPERYTTHYRSAIAFGKMRVLEGGEEKRAAIEKLALKYAPMNSDEHRRSAVESEWDAFYILELRIEHLSGKECIELTRARTPEGK